MCLNNLPRIALCSTAAGSRSRDLLIASPARETLGHRVTHLWYCGTEKYREPHDTCTVQTRPGSAAIVPRYRPTLGLTATFVNVVFGTALTSIQNMQKAGLIIQFNSTR